MSSDILLIYLIIEMEGKFMNILVVNDDGIDGKGIHILARALKKYGNVVVCAPDTGRSASSHAIILHQSLSFEDLGVEDGIHWYKTNGMPADCVRLPMYLVAKKFDIVFSGINNGLNIGTDIIYSGTVSAAREAHIEGLPAVAVSTDFDSFEIVEKEIEKLLDYIFKENLYSKDYVLNVNFPEGKYHTSKGNRFCRQGIKNFKTFFVKNKDNLYDNVDGVITLDQNKDTDVYLAGQGYITFVPLQVDQTKTDCLEHFKTKYEKPLIK